LISTRKKHEWEVWFAPYFPLFILCFSFLRRFSSLHRREKSGTDKIHFPLILNRMEPVEVWASQRPPAAVSGTLTDPVEDLA